MECGFFMFEDKSFKSKPVKHGRRGSRGVRFLALLLAMAAFLLQALPVNANVAISSPSVILIESSTGEVIYEVNSTERRSPASITKIMTL